MHGCSGGGGDDRSGKPTAQRRIRKSYKTDVPKVGADENDGQHSSRSSRSASVHGAIVGPSE